MVLFSFWYMANEIHDLMAENYTKMGVIKRKKVVILMIEMLQ